MHARSVPLYAKVAKGCASAARSRRRLTPDRAADPTGQVSGELDPVELPKVVGAFEDQAEFTTDQAMGPVRPDHVRRGHRALALGRPIAQTEKHLVPELPELDDLYSTLGGRPRGRGPPAAANFLHVGLGTPGGPAGAYQRGLPRCLWAPRGMATPSAASVGATQARDSTSTAPARTSSSTPQEPKISMLRIEIASARANGYGSRLSTRRTGMPYRANTMAVTSPAGPAPTTTTCARIARCTNSS